MRRPLPRAETYKKTPPGTVNRSRGYFFYRGAHQGMSSREQERASPSGRTRPKVLRALPGLRTQRPSGSWKQQGRWVWPKSRRWAPAFRAAREGGVIPLLHMPDVPVGEEDALAAHHELALQRICGPAVAVAGHGDHGQLGVEEGQLLGVPAGGRPGGPPGRLLLLDGLDHAAGVAVGVGKHKNFQKSHLTSSGAYTGMKSSWKGDPV